MAFVRKIKASLVRQDLEDYVGEATYIFHDIVTGELRVSDGTPGGTPIFVPGGGGSGVTTIEDEGTPVTTIATLLNFAGAGVDATEPGLAGQILVTIPGNIDQNLFSTIAVSGQSDIVADTISDTVTFVAGTNITITTNAGNDSITINSAGSSGGISTVEDEGTAISTAATLLNFVGTGVTVTEPGAAGELLVTIPDNGTIWGDITGTLSDQTDLQNALNAASVTTWGDIIGTVGDQTDLVTYIDTATEEEMFAQQVDFINDDLLYRGEAVPGSATSAAVWRIRKITIDNANEGDVITTWAGGTADFDKIYDNRLGLTYT